MQDSAGDELRSCELAVGPTGTGERLTERADLAFQPILEKQPLDPAGIALEQSTHRARRSATAAARSADHL